MQWIYSLAERLEKAFKKMVKSYLPNINIASTSSQTKHQSKENKHQQNEIVKDEDYDDFPHEEVPFTIKLQFVEKLRLISPASIKILTDYISQICPKAFSEGEDGKAQMIIDLLDQQSFQLVSE